MLNILLTDIPVPAWLIIVILIGAIVLLHVFEKLLKCVATILAHEAARDDERDH